MKRPAIAVLCFACALGAAAAGKAVSRKGLQKGAPAMNDWNTAEAGTTKPLPRPYKGAPPLVPHGVEGLSITRETNDCLNCHLEGTDLGDRHVATKVPPSHFVNAFTKEKKTDTVVGMRYQCLACHAPQAKP